MIYRKKKKIAIMIDSLEIGGSETHLLQILPELQKKAWEITVYLLVAVGPIADKLMQERIVIVKPLISKQHGRFKFLNKLIIILNAFKCFFNLCFARPDILHFYLPRSYIIGGTIGTLIRQKNMIMSRRSLNYYQNKYPMLAKVERLLHKKMRLILGNSQAVLNQLITAEKVPASKLKLIYNGIDLDGFAENKKQYVKSANSANGTENVTSVVYGAARSQLKINENALVIVKVANLHSYKGHEVLFQALAKIKNELEPGWRLLCIGKDLGAYNKLVSLAEDLQIADNIIWLNNIADNVVPFLKIADIGVLCSHEEGFSNAILEYMAAHLPIIVTDVGGNAEAIINNESGLVIPKNDSNMLANALEQLINDKVYAKNLAFNAQRRVMTNFSIDKCIASYNDLYNSILR